MKATLQSEIHAKDKNSHAISAMWKLDEVAFCGMLLR